MDASQTRVPPSQFICKRRVYNNTVPIPEIACPPKFIALPFQNVERYAKSGITKLEEEYRYEVWPEDFVKHCPSLVDLDAFIRSPDIKIDEKEAILLEDDLTPATNSKRSQQHSKIVPWMRKTEYISTEFNRFGVNSDRSENKIGYSIKKKFGNQELYRDPASQIVAIKKIFEDANQPVREHYSKRGVHAVEEIPILPDTEQWKHSFTQLIYDSDPLPSNKNSAKYQEWSIAKGMVDEEGNQLMAYFVPTDETLEQCEKEREEGRTFTEDYDYKYVCGRKYDWTVQAKGQKGIDLETYFFTQRNGVMYYCEMETRVKLTRRTKQTSNRNIQLLLRHHDNTEENSV
ncbi:RNA polymerase II-associated factor 1-like protein [Aphelenchoides besseyi]|nr:RNA polymerase II-associated factor 1-like protein [Aphelenchoides besseyi]KAI6200135.1 RNA polymerase II-associated factor 1-like protein [Aphelenchoides besseyi]